MKWNIVRLGDICDVRDGTHDTPKYVDKGVPFITSKNLSTEGLNFTEVNCISYEDHIFFSKRSKVENGDILFGMIGTVGNPVIVNTDFEFSIKNVALLKLANNENLNNRYLLHLVKSDLINRQFKKLKRGGVQSFVALGSIRNLQISLPPLETQKQIAAVLDKADELRQKRKQANAKLDEFLQSVFLDMFGDPIMNEKQWEVKKLKELSKGIMSGNTPKGGSQVYVSCGIEFYRSQNVWNNRIEKKDIAYIDEETHKKMKRSSLKHNDILITKTGRINTENSSLGRSALYEGEDDKANINGHVYFVRLKEGINHKFVLTILTSKEYREYIRRVCVGGIDKRQLNKEHIEDFPIICPPIELQNKFAQIIQKVEQQKVKNETSAQKLDDLFNALLQRAFKGELEFNEKAFEKACAV